MPVIYTQYLVCRFQHFTTLSIFTNKQSPFVELFTFLITSKLLNQEIQDSTDTEHPDLVQISNRNLLCQNHAQTSFPTFFIFHGTAYTSFRCHMDTDHFCQLLGFAENSCQQIPLGKGLYLDYSVCIPAGSDLLNP